MTEPEILTPSGEPITEEFYFVLSIPRSGTRFTAMMLKTRNNQHVIRHIRDDVRDETLRWVRDYTTIIPMRHPRAVALSWARREKKLRWNLEKLWENLITKIDPLDPLYLPVDSPLRGEYLEKIEAALGREIHVDWSPFRGTDKVDFSVGLDMEQDDRIRRLMQRHEAFFDRFWPRS